MAKTIEINILGNTQREQWHSVINMLKPFLTSSSAYGILDELHKYVDWAENMADEIRKEQEDGSDSTSNR